MHFISSSCLIVMARASSTMWIRDVKADILVMFLVLRETLAAFAHWVWLWQWVSHICPLLCFWYVPYVPTLLRVFIINGCWILLNAFSVSIDMVLWFLPFILLMWYSTFIDLRIWYQPGIPRINLTLSWCMVFLRYSWIWSVNVLFRILALMLIRNIGL